MLEEHEHKHAVHEFDGIIENRVATPPVYFTVLFYGLVIWGVAFCAFYLLSGWSSEQEFQAKMTAYQQQHEAGEQPGGTDGQPAAGATAAAAVDAAGLYDQHCAMCHGAEAKGGIGPDLTADEYIYGKTRDAVMTSIADGRPKGMPAFKSKLSDADIAALTDHLLALAGPESDQPAAEGTTDQAPQPDTGNADTAQDAAPTSSASIDAAALYSQHCAMCHGAEAKGGIGPDLTDSKYIFGKTQDKVVESITGGRPKGMPAFKSKLSDAEISALAEYVREL